MKRCIITITILMLGIIACVETGFGRQDQGQRTANNEKLIEKEVGLTEAEFFKKLILPIISAVKEKDKQKLMEIKSNGINLVRGNLLLTVRFENTFLDEEIRLELAGDIKKSNIYFGIAQVIAEMHENAAGNSYLSDKVALFNQWKKEEKEKYLEAKKYYSQGEEARKQYSYDRAVTVYNQALALYQEIGYKECQADCLLCIGEINRMLDEYEKARERYEQGLVIYREIKDRLGEANCHLRLGEVHRMLDEYEKARKRYELGQAIFREIKDSLGEANTLRCLGDVHRMLNEYEKAWKRYEQGLAIYRAINYRLGEANTQKSLGDLHMSLSEYEQARQSYEQGLVIFREIKDSLGEANCLQSLGHVHLQLSENNKARAKYEQALVIFREIKDKLGEANTLRCLGDVHFQLDEFEIARQKYEEALSIQKEIGDRYGKGLSYYGLGQTLEAMSNFSAAEKEYMNSISVFEDVWEEMKLEEFKSPYLTSNIFRYEKLIRLLFKQDNGAMAFPYAEHSKARSFLYLLGNKHIDIKRSVSLNLVRQEEELRQKIAGLAGQIIYNDKKEPGRRTSSTKFNNEILQLKQAHSDILEQIKLICPEYASMISVNPLSTEDIQTLIRQTGNTVFLEYYTTPDAAYLWVLDGKDIFPYKIDINKENLHKKVLQFYNMIATPDTFGVETLQFQAQELYNLLLKPAETHLTGKSRIAVIPHGVLHYLPFEALMNNGKFLAEQDMRFFYLPSASVYKYCRDKNPLKKEQLIALGNPDGSLPFSGQEVKELKRLYPVDTEIFTGKDAKESRVAYYGPYADILHFSCHGGFDAANPMYSALMLAPDGSADGRWEVQEIFQLNLKPAYLVTLSACETNVSDISSGDEMVGLARAFMYAGTPSVLASLWKVDDYYTEKLMVSFYRALKNTEKIEALHQARKEMIEKHGKKHPFYWAPFVLIGDFR